MVTLPTPTFQGKTPEDYVIAIESKLLGVLADLQNSVNTNPSAIYGLAALAFLLWVRLVSAVSLFGAGKLKLGSHELFLVVTALDLGLNLLLVYDLIRIAAVVTRLARNTRELKDINSDSRPIEVAELYLFGLGLSGFVLALARRFAGSIVRRTPKLDDLAQLSADVLPLLSLLSADSRARLPNWRVVLRLVRLYWILGNWSVQLVLLLGLVIVGLAGPALLPLTLLLVDGSASNWRLAPWDWSLLAGSALMVLLVVVAASVLLRTYRSDLLAPLFAQLPSRPMKKGWLERLQRGVGQACAAGVGLG